CLGGGLLRERRRHARQRRDYRGLVSNPSSRRESGWFAMSKKKNVALWVLAGLLALVFLASGGFKFGAQQAIDNFHKWGYPDWFRLLTGVIEVAGGALLLVPRARLFAAAALACTMVGAIATHLMHQEGAMAPVPAVLLLLLLTLLVGRRPRKTSAA
ncbi:MAG TPA: DoxX family protein, partial [Myxococcaceae bacterium]|nr:DoxX family protein [Myxococcaceae bacterium]